MQMRKFSLVIFGLLCFGKVADANSTSLSFGVINVGAPIGFLDSNNKPDGVYAKVSKALSLDLKISSTIEVQPYARLVRLLEDGDLDCAILFTSPGRKKTFHQIGLVTYRTVILVSLKESFTDKSDIPADINGYVIGAIRGSKTAGSVFEYPLIKPYWVENYKQGIGMMEKGRIDAFVGAKAIIESKIDIKDRFVTLRTGESWLQCSKQSPRINPEIITELSQKLAKLRDDGQGHNHIDKLHKMQFELYFNSL
jgi:polar amino acid transport system substrate-binding protein